MLKLKSLAVCQFENSISHLMYSNLCFRMAQNAKDDPKEGNKKKDEASDKCPMNVIFYTIAFFLVCTYGVYVYDKKSFQDYSEQFSPLQPMMYFFEKVEELSPFMEFLEEDNWNEELKARSKLQEPSEKIFTPEELKKFDGSKGSPGIYLALLGQVFDVSKSPKFYGPDGGYGFFAGRDASRAFVTGQFEEEGLIDDVAGLSNSDYIGLDEWISFYHKDYKYVGKLAGRYFHPDGSPTEYYRKLQEWMLNAKDDAMSKENEKKIFPPCNSEWSAEKGQRVWCTKKSGGISRDWIGVPRRLFMPGRAERCACVKDSGKSLFNPGAKTDVGDLDNPHLKTYELCPDPKAASCKVTKGDNE